MADDLATVAALERRLLERVDAEALLHPGFREFGASGTVRDRASVLAALPAEPSEPAVAEELRATAVADGVVLVTYRARRGHHVSLRSSMWCRDAVGWRVRFHQGTPVDLR